MVVRLKRPRQAPDGISTVAHIVGGWMAVPAGAACTKKPCGGCSPSTGRAMGPLCRVLRRCIGASECPGVATPSPENRMARFEAAGEHSMRAISE